MHQSVSFNFSALDADKYPSSIWILMLSADPIFLIKFKNIRSANITKSFASKEIGPLSVLYASSVPFPLSSSTWSAHK